MKRKKEAQGKTRQAKQKRTCEIELESGIRAALKPLGCTLWAKSHPGCVWTCCDQNTESGTARYQHSPG